MAEPVRVAQPPPPFARKQVLGAALALGVLLTAFSSGYGYERDELYFRLLRPAWGYVDQPPLTPLLARAFSAMFADATWAIRIPATLATMTTVVVVALIAREVGGGSGAQTLAAWAFAFGAFPVVFGHVLLTATVDLPVWPAMLLFAIRAIVRGQPKWWLWFGVVAGISMYNKLLVAVLLVALVIGVLAVGPRRLLWSRRVLAGAVVMLVIGLPNLIYQAAHGWPQFAVGRALADENAGDVHIKVVPFLFLMLGPPLVPIWLAGLWRLWRTPALRFIAVSFPVLIVLVFVMGAQFYYPLGLLTVLFAVGCAPAGAWLATRAGWRRWTIAGVALNAAVSITLGLPVIPRSVVGSTPIASINQVVQDSVGWPAYVAQIARVYRAIPAARRGQAIVLTSNYGEAGAVDRYGARYGLPTVYSGQNALGRLPQPRTRRRRSSSSADSYPLLGGCSTTAWSRPTSTTASMSTTRSRTSRLRCALASPGDGQWRGRGCAISADPSWQGQVSRLVYWTLLDSTTSGHAVAAGLLGLTVRRVRPGELSARPCRPYR